MAKDLRAIVSQIQDLPTLPQVVTTLLTLMDDPESSAEDVNRVLERERNPPKSVAGLVVDHLTDLNVRHRDGQRRNLTCLDGPIHTLGR